MRSRICIYIDNQAAIRSLAKLKGKPGVYLLKAIMQITEELQQDGLPVEIRWIPAHIGIWGNEQADKAAKEATGWREGRATRPWAAEPAEL
jgi:ribonuclease HI